MFHLQCHQLRPDPQHDRTCRRCCCVRHHDCRTLLSKVLSGCGGKPSSLNLAKHCLESRRWLRTVEHCRRCCHRSGHILLLLLASAPHCQICARGVGLALKSASRTAFCEPKSPLRESLSTASDRTPHNECIHCRHVMEIPKTQAGGCQYL
ncbi:hypothetical protein F4808DRAFT_40409 [Astrocystis sublimbata]|nr:hypothetical protein F4808DRAFT_40409 [Astrocystis sublimbata]